MLGNDGHGVLDQKVQVIEGDITFYLPRWPGDSCQMAYAGSWVAALFESLDAARSWAFDLNEAEEAFRAGGRKLLGVRT